MFGLRRFHTCAKNGQALLNKLNLSGDIAPVPNNITQFTSKGLLFDNGTIVKSTCLLLSNQILELPKSHSTKGHLIQFNVDFLKLINPLPELLVIGTGASMKLLHPSNQDLFKELGVKCEVSDTKSAVKNFDLLASERRGQVGALLVVK